MCSLISFLVVTILTFITTVKDGVAYPTENIPNFNVNSRIIKGSAAKEAHFPYAAGIELTDYDGDISDCVGTLISSTSVLTSAHCLEGTESVVVTLGALNINPSSTEKYKKSYVSTEFIMHPNFNASKHPPPNDLAIIKLRNPASLNTHVKVIHIPTDDKDTYDGKTGTTMGWGLTSKDADGTVLPNLQYITNPVLSNKDCIKSQPSSEPDFKTIIKDELICLSGHGGKTICNGDSGGPLVVNKILVGVLSFGSIDCIPGHVSVFTRLSKYITWINAHK